MIPLHHALTRSVALSTPPKVDITNRAKSGDGRKKARRCAYSIQNHGLENADGSGHQTTQNGISYHRVPANDPFAASDFALNPLGLCFCSHKSPAVFRLPMIQQTIRSYT